MNERKIIYILVFFLPPIQMFGDDVHSMTGFFIGTQGLSLPSYMERISVNGVTIFYHDSRKDSIAPCPEWLNTTAGQQHWADIRDISHHNRQIMNIALESAIEQFNLSGVQQDINIYQGYSRCDLYPNGTMKAWLTHAFNGKDFLSLDLESMTYIASVRQAEKHKRQRERNPVLIGITVSFYKKTCFDRLKLFLQHSPELNSKQAPKVRLFEKQQAGSTLLTCHVTGFYPRALQVKWIGADLQPADDEVDDALPNGDGTYQTRRSVIRPGENTDQKYSCVVNHSSLQGNITVTWVKEQRPFRLPAWITLSCMFMVTVVGLAVRRLCLSRCYRK